VGGLAGGGDGALDCVLVCTVEDADEGAVGRVVDLDGWSGNGCLLSGVSA
jgi:hypothetical protein